MRKFEMIVFDDVSATLFTGDLVAMGLTPSLDGSLKGWLDWLDSPPDPAPERIVPGHGPVTAGWDKAIAPTRAYLTGLRDATRAAVAQGLPLSQAVPEIVAALQPISAGWADFDATTARNASAAYAELEWE